MIGVLFFHRNPRDLVELAVRDAADAAAAPGGRELIVVGPVGGRTSHTGARARRTPCTSVPRAKSPLRPSGFFFEILRVPDRRVQEDERPAHVRVRPSASSRSTRTWSLSMAPISIRRASRSRDS